jgi:hypothetical protein
MNKDVFLKNTIPELHIHYFEFYKIINSCVIKIFYYVLKSLLVDCDIKDSS